MCQLTFVNLHDVKVNELMSMILSTVNSQVHNDGFGLFKPAGENTYYLNKIQYAAYLYLNLGEMYRASGKNTNPILSHVRKASAVNGVREVKAEYSHPFMGEQFIFAHNGYLEPKDWKLFNQHKDKTDSMIFHMFLEELAKKNPDRHVVELLNEVYKTHFDGKFAFLLFNQKDEKFYAARGDTAQLHMAKIQVYKNWKKEELITEGYVVNTEEASFLTAIVLFKNLLELLYGYHVPYDKDMIKLLPANSVYFLDKDEIIKIGEITETKKYTVATTTTAYGGATTNHNTNYTTTTNTNNAISEDIKKLSEEIIAFLRKWDVSLSYLDLIVLSTLGKSLLSIEKTDVDKISAIMRILDQTTVDQGKLLQAWRSLFLSEKFFDDLAPHLETSLPFPYMSVKNLEEFRGVGDAEELDAIINTEIIDDDDDTYTIGDLPNDRFDL